MRLRAHIALSGLLGAGLTLAGCSMNIAKYDLQEFPKTVPFFEPISIVYGGDTIQLEANLQRAYTRAVDTASYPMENCRGSQASWQASSKTKARAPGTSGRQ